MAAHISNSQNRAGGQITVRQINLAKRSTANVHINEWITKGDNRIALVQEPKQKKGKIVLTNKGTAQYATGTRPRACILVSKNLQNRIIKLILIN